MKSERVFFFLKVVGGGHERERETETGSAHVQTEKKIDRAR